VLGSYYPGMGVSVQEAAGVIVPYLSAGADAAAGDLSASLGAQAATAIVALLGKIRARLAGPVDQEGVAAGIRSALDAGEFSEDELRSAVKTLNQAGHHNTAIQGDVYEGNVYRRNVIDTGGGDFHG
jgi:cytochrome P450